MYIIYHMQTAWSSLLTQITTQPILACQPSLTSCILCLTCNCN